MNKQSYFFLSVLFCISCNGNKQIEHTFITPEIISDSIYTTMPGDLFYCGEHLAWCDPFSKEGFLHIIDLNTKEEIGVMGETGIGPREFVTPGVGTIFRDGLFFVFDYNGQNIAFFSLDSLLQGKDYYLPVDYDLPKGTQIEQNVFVGKTKNDSPHYFLLNHEGDMSTFGDYPIENLQEHFGGDIAYKPDKGYLVHTVWGFPYIALYQKKEKRFELLWKRVQEPDYHIADENVVLNNETRGARGVAFMKDYIVTLERDRRIDQTDEDRMGRDFTKCPHTVFLYSYEGELRKIINISMPIVRITANPHENVFYAMVVNPDFTLIKCDVESDR